MFLKTAPGLLRPQRFAVHATLRWSARDRPDTAVPSPLRSGRAWRTDQNRRLQKLRFCSLHQHRARSVQKYR